MTLQKFWIEDEDEGCMNCGELEFDSSRTEGLCIECNPCEPEFNIEDFYYLD